MNTKLVYDLQTQRQRERRIQNRKLNRKYAQDLQTQSDVSSKYQSKS